MADRAATLKEDLAAQREFLSARVPVYARLLELLEAELGRGLGKRLEEAWRDRRFGAFYERPLLLLGALRDDALREGESHPLSAAVTDPVPDPSVLDERSVARALSPERTHLWHTLAERSVQTNEPTRAVAWLWPARLAEEAAPGRTLELYDVGASAGLNLVADRLAPIWERAEGEPLRVGPIGRVAARVGFDLRPLDVLDDEDARWLAACVWPGQGARETRLAEAIAAFRRAQVDEVAPTVRSARTAEVPALLPHGEDGRLALVCQTVVRDYLPPAEWVSYSTGLVRWLDSRPPGSALWIELEVTETDGDDGPPATLTVHGRTRSGPLDLVLARCEPHPIRLAVDEAAVARLRSALAGSGTGGDRSRTVG